jgi:hypothetical protein
MLLAASKPVQPEALINVLLLTVMSSHGSVVPLVPLLLGNEVVAMIVVVMIPVILAQLEMRHHGQEIVDVGKVATITSEVKTATTPLLPDQLPHHGNKLLLRILSPPLVAMLATLLPDMALAILKQTLVLLLVSLLLLD